MHRSTHRKQGLDVLLLGGLGVLSLLLVPGIPLGLADKVEHAGARGVDVTDGGLLVERIEGKLIVLRGLDLCDSERLKGEAEVGFNKRQWECGVCRELARYSQAHPWACSGR